MPTTGSAQCDATILPVRRMEKSVVVAFGMITGCKGEVKPNGT